MRWSSCRMRSTRSSALRCPSWRRNTLTICSRLLERLPPAGFSLVRSGRENIGRNKAGRMTRPAVSWRGSNPRRTRRPGLQPRRRLMMVPAAAFALDVERRTASTGRRGVRIADGEAATGHRIDEVDLGALEIADAHRVDIQL